MTANNILQYSEISLLLCLHQKSFLLQQMGIKMRPMGRHYNWRHWNTHPYVECLHQLPPLMPQETLQKRWKDCKSQKEWKTPMRQDPRNQQDQCMWTQRLRQRAQGEPRWGPRSYLQLITIWMWVSRSLQRSVTGDTNNSILKARLCSHSRWLTQNKFTLCAAFLEDFCLMMLCQDFLFFLVYILWFPVLCFYGISVCGKACVSASVCISSVFSLASFLWIGWLVLFWFAYILSNFILDS